jgi:hypothetical protein
MMMWIRRRYQDGVPLHTVLYWGVLRDVPHKISMDDGDPHDVDMELEGNGALIFMMMHLSLHICK